MDKSWVISKWIWLTCHWRVECKSGSSQTEFWKLLELSEISYRITLCLTNTCNQSQTFFGEESGILPLFWGRRPSKVLFGVQKRADYEIFWNLKLLRIGAPRIDMSQILSQTYLKPIWKCLKIEWTKVESRR